MTEKVPRPRRPDHRPVRVRHPEGGPRPALRGPVAPLRQRFVAARSQRIKLAPEQAIFLFVASGTLPPSVAALQAVYDKYKDEDGFLYMTYRREGHFGRRVRCEWLAAPRLPDAASHSSVKQPA